MDKSLHLVNVFTYQGAGGNLAPIVLNAVGMTDAQMREVACKYGRESSFVFPAPHDVDADFELRFFVPEHEMEMCGHATVGTAWVLRHLSLVTTGDIKFLTRSGIVKTKWLDDLPQGVAVSQPPGSFDLITDENLVKEIVSVLGIAAADLSGIVINNACTSRVKTTIRLPNEEALNSLSPDFASVEHVCQKLGSTGLYPYALIRNENTSLVVEARQFPKASGYPEDAATGIAAAALAYALADDASLMSSQKLIVRQGRAMGFLSEITVQLGDNGCWISGTCTMA